MNSTKFYFDSLPKFVTILKDSLSEELDKNSNLTIEDHVKVFFSFYNLNNAYDYFKVFKVESDEMYLGIYLDRWKSKIYMERAIRIEGWDEEYQIQFELILDIPSPQNRVSETFEVERDILGDFSHWEEGYFSFEDFQEKVLSSNVISDFLCLCPKSIRISLNADI